MMQKVAVRLRVRGWASACDNWKTPSVNPALNGYLFEFGQTLQKDQAYKEGLLHT